MKKFFIIIFLVALILVSCSSVTEVQSISVKPNWIENSSSNENYLFYVIYSQSDSIESVRQKAYEDFINQFTNELSIVDEKKYLLESFLNNNFLLDYGVELRKNYYFDSSNDFYQAYFLFSVDRKKYEAKLKTNVEKFSEMKKEINNILNNSNEYYRENYDIKAFSTLIDAYILARESNIDSSYIDKNDILTRCVKILKAMTIEAYDFDKENITCFFQLYRNIGLISPNILDGKIEVSYTAYSPNLTPYVDKQVIKINEKDESYFLDIKNKSITDSGVLLVKLDITEELNKLLEKGYFDAYEVLNEINNTYIFDFDQISFFKNKKVVFAIFENDLNQVSRNSQSFLIIKEYLEDKGASVILFDNSLEDIEEIKKEYKGNDLLVVFKAEVTGKYVDDISSIKTTGSVEVYDIFNSKLLFDSGLYDNLVNSKQEDIALDEVFLDFAKKGIFYLESNFN